MIEHLKDFYSVLCTYTVYIFHTGIKWLILSHLDKKNIFSLLETTSVILRGTYTFRGFQLPKRSLQTWSEPQRLQNYRGFHITHAFYFRRAKGICSFPPGQGVYEVWPESIQPCNMKNRDIYWRRYKIKETLYIGQWHLSPLQSMHLGTSHSSPSCRQLPRCVFLNLTKVWNLFPFKGDFSFGKS